MWNDKTLNLLGWLFFCSDIETEKNLEVIIINKEKAITISDLIIW